MTVFEADVQELIACGRYVYMVSFDRSEFVMGGVLYQQTAQLDNVRPLAPSAIGACHAFCT